MLVLTRRKGEIIVIGQGDDLVEVMILDRRLEQYKIGIRAARHILVDREEIYRAKLESNSYKDLKNGTF